jgi:hypothetical protein
MSILRKLMLTMLLALGAIAVHSVGVGATTSCTAFSQMCQSMPGCSSGGCFVPGPESCMDGYWGTAATCTDGYQTFAEDDCIYDAPEPIPC